MSLLSNTKARLQSVLDEVAHLKQSEFPYPASFDALEAIFINLKEYAADIDDYEKDTGADQENIITWCSDLLRTLGFYIPRLGFILRSTNVRNAFELYRPFLRLAEQILKDSSEKKIKLILSSEWDYSPYTYEQSTVLPGFLLIGLPASESSNPLLLPLCGHELGHAIWKQRAMNGKVGDAIQSAIDGAKVVYQDEYRQFMLSVDPTGLKKLQTIPKPVTRQNIPIESDLFQLRILEDAFSWAGQQAEETFADCVGIRLFGRSYLYAFAYLLAPNNQGNRSPRYPNTLTRIKNMLHAADRYGFSMDAAEYLKQFADKPDSRSFDNQFRSKIADTAHAEVVDRIINDVDGILKEANSPQTDEEQVEKIVNRYRRVVPAQDVRSLADIVNAGWRVFNDATFWDDTPQISTKKSLVLKELVLKNIELLEIESLTSALQQGTTK